MRDWNAETLVKYLRRSYQAVDGLWFMMLEAEHSYAEALRLDTKVWEILPKIQARKASELLGLSNESLQDLARALEFKFDADGSVEFDIRLTEHELVLEVQECPWLSILNKAGRDAIALEVCEHICDTEMRTWAAELAPAGTRFVSDCKLSAGDRCCAMRFTSEKPEDRGGS